eukprot:7239138-Lingulodinium_polyedra.AAC.1
MTKTRPLNGHARRAVATIAMTQLMLVVQTYGFRKRGPDTPRAEPRSRTRCNAKMNKSPTAHET